MSQFVNYSSHPSDLWESRQTEAALQLGDRIVDVPFPRVDPTMSREEIESIAKEEVIKIMEYSPSIVMCQGEFNLCYAVVNILKGAGIRVVAACSERNTKMEKGKKVTDFEFIQFREY